MNCEEARAFLEGCATSPPDDPAVAAHLRQCSACSDYAAGLPGENRMLEQVLTVLPGEARWQRVKTGLAARLSWDAALRRRKRRILWAAAAAVLAFSVTTALLRRAGQPGPSEVLAASVTTLQEEVRAKQVLDELEQLQIAFRETGDADGRSVAEDAELYVVRILALDARRPDETREILAGINAAGIHDRLQRVRESIAEDAPAPLRASLELAAATLTRAARLADTRGRSHAR